MVRKKKKQLDLDYFGEDCDDTFAYIIGYTSGGTPYGITWEQWEKDDDKSNHLPANLNDGDLPF